jgi:hypothetical protein
VDWNVAMWSKKAKEDIYLEFFKDTDSVVHSKLTAKETRYEVNKMQVKRAEVFFVCCFHFVRNGPSISVNCSV